MKRDVVVAKLDSIVDGCLIKSDGVVVPDHEVPIFVEFDQQHTVGLARLRVSGSELIAEIVAPDDTSSLKGFYPSIGFVSLKETIENDVRSFESIGAICVGACKSKNVDESIEPIE